MGKIQDITRWMARPDETNVKTVCFTAYVLKDGPKREAIGVARLRRNDPDVDALWGDTLDEMVDYEAGRHRESIGDYIFGSDEVLPIEVRL